MSEQQLHAKLNMSGIPRGSNATKRRRPQKIVRQIEVGMIQEIEKLRAQLQVDVFTQSRVLQQRHIHVLISRTIENVSSRVPKSARRRETECSGIEPAFRRAITQRRISHDVGPVVCPESKN